MRGFLFPLAVAAAVVLAAPANAVLDPAAPSMRVAIPPLYKNCTNLNKRYPHGLGRRLARDHTSGTPVRNFYRSTRLYNVAMSHNRGLDRDKDGIACEKR
jgi:Excalibur calcium-binding domain